MESRDPATEAKDWVTLGGCLVGHDEIDIFQDQDDLETPFRAYEDEARWTILTHDLTLGKSECILDNLIFLGWNCDIGIKRRKRCFIFGWISWIFRLDMGYLSLHVTFACSLRHSGIWLGEYIHHLLKSIEYISMKYRR